MFVAAPRARLLLLGAGAVLLAGLARRSLRRRAASGAITRSPTRTGDPSARTLVRVEEGAAPRREAPQGRPHAARASAGRPRKRA